jgi:hypothetical protein
VSNEALPRNANRVRLELPAVDHAIVQRALERGIRSATGDPSAAIGWYPTDDGEDFVIIVKQEHATWWTMMPSGFAEMIGGYSGTTTLRWHDSEPPRAVDD